MDRPRLADPDLALYLGVLCTVPASVRVRTQVPRSARPCHPDSPPQQQQQLPQPRGRLGLGACAVRRSSLVRCSPRARARADFPCTLIPAFAARRVVRGGAASASPALRTLRYAAVMIECMLVVTFHLPVGFVSDGAGWPGVRALQFSCGLARFPAPARGWAYEPPGCPSSWAAPG